MIQSGFTYLSALLFLSGLVVQLEKKFKKIFRYIPGIVLLYFLVMVFASFGVWKQTDEINLYNKQLKDNLLPVMIFLMLLRCDLRNIMKLGPRMLLGFFSATFSICAGFIITFWLFKSHYESHTWKAFAALCGSWIGGTGNMAAVQLALGLTDSQMGYALLMDSVNYSIWVMVLLAGVPFARHFNSWTGSNTDEIDRIGAKLAEGKTEKPSEMDFSHLTLLLGSSFLVSSLSGTIASFLPTTTFITVPTWTVLIATIAGISVAMTSMGKTPGISHLANLILFLVVALMGSRANFSELTKAPFYIFSGFFILLIHAIFLVFFAKIFKLDLFTCGVASLANIGGVASAPILAAAYNEVLIPVGVLMALLGYIIGTGGGLAVGKILSMI
ncbi:DUF819 domain-containing protein [bacterium]|nr:DUF819 domain-containing protein [bacterium]